MTQGYELYGAEVSYFTGKVRAYLRYKRIPFRKCWRRARSTRT